MPIRQFTQEIGIKPAGQGISEFSTSLPASDLSGVRRFASSLADIGEEFMKADAKQTAEDAANGTQIVKNENGEYERVAAPETYGPYARNIFNAAVDQNYINTVYRDVENELNIIASDRQMLPNDRIAKMDSHIAGVLKNVDPKFIGIIGPILGRERNQRQGSILNLAASESRSALITSLNNSSKLALSSLINHLAINDIEGANQVKANLIATKRQELTLSSNGDQTIIDRELATIDASIKGIEYLAPILAEVKQGISDETIAPDELSTFIKMLTTEAPLDATAFGYTTKDIIDNVNEPALQEMRSVFQNVFKDYAERFRISGENKKATDLKDVMTSSNLSMLPSWASQEDLARAIRLEYGDDIYSPEKIREIGFRYNGVLPDKPYSRFFENAWMVDVTTEQGRATLAKQFFAYETLQKISTKEGIKDRTDLISNSKDRNFFRIVQMQMSGGSPKTFEQAAKIAQTAIQNGIGMDDQARNNIVRDKFRAIYPNTEATDINILSKVTNNVAELPVKLANQIWEAMAITNSQGLPFEMSIEDGKKVLSRWKSSQFVISNEGGSGQSLVPEEVLMLDANTNLEIIDPDTNKPSIDYLKIYIDPLLKNGMYEDAHGKLTFDKSQLEQFGIKTDNLKFGENVKLEPTGGSGAFYLAYYDKNVRVPIRLRDEYNQTIVISPLKTARKYLTYLNEKKLQETVDINKDKKERGFIERTLIPKNTVFQNFNIWNEKENRKGVADLLPDDRYNAWLGRNIQQSSPNAQTYIKKINDNLVGDEAYLAPIASKVFGFESNGFDPTAKNPRSSAHGIGQITQSTWDGYNKKWMTTHDKPLDRNNPDDQLWVAIEHTKFLGRFYKQAFNKEPSLGDFYVLWQQGHSGGYMLLNNPNKNAIDVLTTAHNGNRKIAIKAITDNLRDNLKHRAGSLKAKDFIQIIKGYVE